MTSNGTVIIHIDSARDSIGCHVVAAVAVAIVIVIVIAIAIAAITIL